MLNDEILSVIILIVPKLQECFVLCTTLGTVNVAYWYRDVQQVP